MRTHLSGFRLILPLLMIPVGALAQEPEKEAATEEHARHEVSLMLCHTHVSEGVGADGKHAWTLLPSWGLNYNYWLSAHWAIGLHTDLITETFAVSEDMHEGDEEPVVERTHPVAPAVMVTYRPHEHWAFILGAGEEFAKEEDLFLLRAGVEYTIHLSGRWETSGSIAYDARLDAYDSATLGFGITRTFR